MKIKLIYLSDYVFDLYLYLKKDIDFFSFLILKIITDSKISEEKTFNDILFDLEFSIEMIYLFNNAYFYLLDNQLVKGKDTELATITKKEVKLTNLGEKCLEALFLPEFEEKIEKNVIYDPINNKLLASNNYNDSNDIIVLKNDQSEAFLTTLVNTFKNNLFPSIDKDLLIYQNLKEANPLLIELELIKKAQGYFFKEKIDSKLLEKIVSNLVYLNLEHDNFIEEEANVFTNNLKFEFAYISTPIANSKFNLQVNNNKAFKIEENIIYLPEEFLVIIENKSFIINDSLLEFQYKTIPLEKDYFLPFIKTFKNFKLNQQLKNWFISNKENFSNKEIINQLINKL